MEGERLNGQINVTPLADVMLVLLIIFMVVTPLIKPGVDVTVPRAENPEEYPGDDSTLTLSMREDGSIFLNRDRVTEEEVASTLSSLLERRTEKSLFLKASEALDYGRVLAMMERCHDAGAREVALVTREEDSTRAPRPPGSGRAPSR